MPGVFIGSTEIVDVGKIKVGSTDVQEIYVGATKIWPQNGGDPSITFDWDPENDQALPGGATFTRASVAQQFDGTSYTQVSSGTIRDSNVAVGGSAQGYLSEPAGRNETLDSNDLTQSSWDARGTGAVADLGVTSIGGNSSRLSGINNSGNDVLQSINGVWTADATLAPLIWIRRVSTTGTVQISHTGGATRGSWQVDLSAIGSDWVLLENGGSNFTEDFPWEASPTGNAGFQFTASIGGPLSFDISFVNLVEENFSMSPVVTGGSAATRVADVLDTGEIIPSEFSVLLDLTLPTTIGSGNTITLIGPDATAEDILLVDAGFNVIMDDGGTPVTIGTSSAGARIKVAYGRNAGDRSGSFNGATAVDGGAPGAGHEGDNFQLGCANSVNQSRCIHHLTTLYDEKKSDAELETLAS